MFDPKFMGKNGFVWWVGVVEDRNDPLQMGRCRVRILGFHTDNTDDLPTENLAWAVPIMPITSASMSGMGQAPIGPVEGTRIFGFFADGMNGQIPMMLGTMPGYHTLAKNSKAKYPLEVEGDLADGTTEAPPNDPDVLLKNIDSTEQDVSSIRSALKDTMEYMGMIDGFTEEDITKAVDIVAGSYPLTQEQLNQFYKDMGQDIDNNKQVLDTLDTKTKNNQAVSEMKSDDIKTLSDVVQPITKVQVGNVVGTSK